MLSTQADIQYVNPSLKKKIQIWAMIVLTIVGLLYLAMSLIFGFAAAPHYEKILAASLKMGAFSTGIFAICLTISNWKHKWIFLVPIVFQIINALQAIGRLNK
jgi:hypothetical protein